MVRDGSPLHQSVLGSLAGVALDANRAWFNAGYFARGEGGMQPGMHMLHCVVCNYLPFPALP
jgi:hypothetical protein